MYDVMFHTGVMKNDIQHTDNEMEDRVKIEDRIEWVPYR